MDCIIINEISRIYSVGSGIMPRILIEDTTIGGVHIKK